MQEAANIDGHSVVANNIIADFGYGNARWIWQDADPTPLLLNLNKAQRMAPAMAEVIVTGNVIYDTGRDQILVDGKPQVEPPRYHYAVKFPPGEKNMPEGIQISDNLFHPGVKGVANGELTR